MAAIKGKERVLKKPMPAIKAKLSATAKKKLREHKSYQPIATVCVS